MQKEYAKNWKNRENETLERLLKLEDLALKKAGIYANLLTEQSLAQDMAEISKRHAERKGNIEKLLYGEKSKSGKDGDKENEA